MRFKVIGFEVTRTYSPLFNFRDLKDFKKQNGRRGFPSTILPECFSYFLLPKMRSKRKNRLMKSR